ncbi:MAG TPA: hypothetical protein GX696_08550 [Pseudomonadaceae bacterium]|nr:hypothetical protein [Pseudomonadaceae bacterium]
MKLLRSAESHCRARRWHCPAPRRLLPLLLGLGLLLPALAPALEEDASMEVVIDANSSDYTLDGVLELYGSADKPVRITQGTLEITGLEVHIEQQGDAISTLVAYGTPARFRQQLNPGEEPIQAMGLTLRFDNSAQTLSIVEQAEIVLPNGTRSTGYQFDYDLQSKRMRSDSPAGEGIRIVIPPGAGQ